MLGNLTLSGTGVLIGIVLMTVLVIGLVVFLRNLFSKRSSSTALAEKHSAEVDTTARLQSRAKYPEVNAFRYSNSFLLLGLVLSLGLVVMAFNWTQREQVVDIPDNALEIPDDIEVEPPRTAEPPPPPPPPPPPVIQEVPEEEILEEDEPEFVDQTIEEETVIERPEPIVEEKAPPPPPPPPPPPKPKAPQIFKVVEDMPRFPGCEDMASKADKKKCSDEKMIQFIYKNIKYPAIARENGVEGTCVVSFVVEKDGSVTQAEVVRDIGAGCGEEALRVVELMNKKGIKWIPGKQRGRAVRVQFNLPVKFRLE